MHYINLGILIGLVGLLIGFYAHTDKKIDKLSDEIKSTHKAKKGTDLFYLLLPTAFDAAGSFLSLLQIFSVLFHSHSFQLCQLAPPFFASAPVFNRNAT